eukprot:TRINITY_DN8526_c0_g1_i1.p1 TRINITY_DN8526_c0_g1~~TRINITY_DN8526_c0_g1_i1.p1  ORF type:complete len:419 (+),score=55.40 TRINITY_DN8526_c0_g1_i1:50-1306(+)
MNKRFFFLLVCILGLTSSIGIPADSYDSSKTLTKIAFGSCNRPDMNQALWNTITDYQPDIWIWLGDVVYADRQKYPGFWESTDLDVMKSIYNAQKQSPQYLRLISNCSVVGVWDDHDYGKNDGGIEYADKDKVQHIFLDFLDEPTESIRHQRSGVYASYTFGPPGSKVKIILLDTRYFRESDYGDGDMLGEQQWIWLENQLKESDAQFHLIGSSIQVLPTDKAFVEKWGCLPNSRRRLQELIASSNASGVILLSGDVHHGELLREDCQRLRYPLYEVTSSGITHSCYKQTKIFGINVCDLLLKSVLKSRFQLGYLTSLNFGTIEIKWGKNPAINLQLRDESGKVQISTLLQYSDLQPVPGERLDAGPCLDDNVFVWIKWPKGLWLKYIVIGLAASTISFILAVTLWYKFKTHKKEKVN